MIGSLVAWLYGTLTVRTQKAIEWSGPTLPPSVRPLRLLVRI